MNYNNPPSPLILLTLARVRIRRVCGRAAQLVLMLAIGMIALPAWSTLTSVTPTQISINVTTGGVYSFSVIGSIGETVSSQSLFCSSVGVPVPANGIIFPAAGGCSPSSVTPVNPVAPAGTLYGFTGTITPTQAASLLADAIAAGQPAGNRFMYWRQGFGMSGFAIVRVNLIEPTSAPPTLLPASIAFGNVQVGQSSPTQSVTFSTGFTSTTPPLTISHPSWTVATSNCPALVASNLSCQITMRCVPTAVGALSGTASVTVGTFTASSNVTCNGVAAPASASPTLLPGSANYGAVAIGAAAVTQSFTLTNSSATALSGLSLSVPVGFSQTSNCGVALAANASCQINVSSSPLAAQAYSGELRVTAGTVNLSSALSGLGTAAPVIAGPSTLTDVSPKRLVGNVSSDLTQMLTYAFTGNTSTVSPGEGVFCLDLIAVLPAGNTTTGNPCASSSQFARHPTIAGSFQSTRIGTYIRSVRETIRVPSAVSRFVRESGRNRYYFARQFSPNQYAVVAIELLGNVANQPLAITDMRMYFKQGGEQPIVFLKRGDALPMIEAKLAFTGSGWLRGAWEVVQPGDIEPAESDLVTDASLPLSQRGLQRRYAVVGTFQHYQPAVGQITLTPPDLSRFPVRVDGAYRVVLRLFADAAIGADNDSGFGSGAAGFALPTARYFVGSFASHGSTSALASITLSQPSVNHKFAVNEAINFRWQATRDAAVYLLEAADTTGQLMAAAQVPASAIDLNAGYRAPQPWRTKASSGAGAVRWRVTAFSRDGEVIARSEWRSVRF